LSIKAGKSVVTSCTTSYTGVPEFSLYKKTKKLQ
jgi:hypothetical protein